MFRKIFVIKVRDGELHNFPHSFLPKMSRRGIICNCHDLRTAFDTLSRMFSQSRAVRPYSFGLLAVIKERKRTF